ncbi:MAG: 2-C-methyl-D-erythritol 4-phosphate cytidylyltransferase, partial [Planctomycetes bacterium]|nr:2-C-methyl-D-erythritol 4-phosphate cytidylyltransferase [Planctomycetota bacterium]
AVHDAVRPFFSLDAVSALFAIARRRGAAGPGIPLSDTLKQVEGDVVTETPRRAGLMRVQTPQVFRSDLLIEAYEYAIRTGGLSERITDDAQLVEALGREVAAVATDELNLKITSPLDMKIAQALLAAGLVE